MLFDLPHILFMQITAVVIVLLLVLSSFFIKTQESKNLVLRTSAIVTVILHYSILYVDWFTTGSAEVSGPMLLPIHPCNVAMWLLVITAFCKNKQTVFFKTVSEITFYLGIVGGILGIVLNENYSSTPSLADWEVLKGLLSHATMLFGCIYLLVGEYIKIRVNNLISIFVGLMLLLVDGVFIIGLYSLFNLDPPNSMYLLSPPFASAPWLNTPVIGVMALVLFFAITAIYEQATLEKEDRWYSKLKARHEENKLKRLK